MHPRWGSPVAAIIVQSVLAVFFIFLGQGGTTVKGAYDVIVSAMVVINLIPFLYLFGSAMLLHGETASRGIVIPGGKLTVTFAAAVGLFATVAAMILAFFPADDEPNKLLAVVKVLLITAIVLGSGAFFYFRRTRRLLVTPADALRPT